MSKQFLSVNECAEYLNISAAFVRKLIRNKNIEHIRLEGKILFKKDKLDSWVKENTIKTEEEA